MKYLTLTFLIFFSSFRVQAQFLSKAARDSLARISNYEHHLELAALGIEKLRNGANGNDPKAPNYVNYLEEKASIYPNLPNPLFTNGRLKVEDAETWWKVRRPEIVEMFDREVYGRMPENLPEVDWQVIETKEEQISGQAVVSKRIRGVVDNSSYPAVAVHIELNLSVPKKQLGKGVPVVMEFSWGFDFRRREGDNSKTWKEQVVDRGWAFATLIPTSVQADNGAGLRSGIIGLCNKGLPRQTDDWGALRAWAWGGSRAIDYFESNPDIDAKRVAIEGHSRYGKAAAVAMAYDTRFAVGFISSSGAGGLKLYRRDYGEQVENVAGTGEFHWMAPNFMKYAGPLSWDDLPVDAHELLALIAPRPVFVSAGNKGDQWVDPKGMFEAAAEVSPVYTLLGKKALGTSQFPQVEEGVLDGDLVYRQHNEGHTPNPNWPYFLDFASRYFEPN
ncbi:acetylxylan esterase [Marinilongibacter aquaticus]|uniref:alpha/beta hydrolase n=1 Tax=Marinilongibacter aquaticus TaxID=2975157 RepID=UPI0021BDC9A7|nr:acetylxylan esterase [Marinilongibacter aquaticus]UBM57737.1 acetylxylan esterase [Marinilongibacter aquaticus]